MARDSETNETIIASAVQRGAISVERAAYYRTLAAEGHDIGILDELTSVRARQPGQVMASGMWRTAPGSAIVHAAAGSESPLADDMRKSHPALVQAAMAEGPPPPLFGPQGGLPIVCASGIPPESLSRLPWQARRPVAAASTAAAAYELMRKAETSIGLEELARHPENREYIDSVSSWLKGDEANVGEGGQPDGRTVAAAAAQDSDEAAAEYTAAQLHAELFRHRRS